MSDATTTREKYLADLEQKAATGDIAARRALIREGMLDKQRELTERGAPDANGRLPGDYGYVGREEDK